jgi:hypothetical protein
MNADGESAKATLKLLGAAVRKLNSSGGESSDFLFEIYNLSISNLLGQKQHSLLLRASTEKEMLEWIEGNFYCQYISISSTTLQL